MKKIMIVLTLLLMLTGCSSEDPTTHAMALRSRLLGAQSCTFDAVITADYGDKIYTFAMGCQVDAHGNLSFTVQQPESIAGITGLVTTDGGKLTFDDTVLAFSLLADDRLSPVSAPWVLMKALRSGYIASCDKNCMTFHDSYADDALVVDVICDASLIPVQADIYWEGRRIVAMKLENFTLS